METLNKPRTARRWAWSASVAGGALSIVLAARYSLEAPAAPTGTPGMTVSHGTIALASDAPQWTFVKLGTVTTATTHWTDPIPARITMDQTRASKVGAPVGGRVTRVFVELGQRVEAGQPLFSVASPDIAELRAAREKAAVELDAARAALERVKAIVATRALPAKEELSASQQYQEAEVALRLADSKLQSLRVTSAGGQSEFSVCSPRHGVVVEKSVLVDEQVSPDAPLMVVADLSSVWVVADLFEADAAAIREGVAARVTSPSMPDETIEGVVDMVSSVVDPGRHTLPVRVRLANPQGLLRPNLYARVRFAAGAKANGLEIPASALVSDGDRQYVYVRGGDGAFARREVSVGPSHEGRLPVLAGLAAGETVVEEGAILLDNQLALAE